MYPPYWPITSITLIKAQGDTLRQSGDWKHSVLSPTHHDRKPGGLSRALRLRRAALQFDLGEMFDAVDVEIDDGLRVVASLEFFEHDLA